MKCWVLCALFVLAVAQDRPRERDDPWAAANIGETDCVNLAQFTGMWGIFDGNDGLYHSPAMYLVINVTSDKQFILIVNGQLSDDGVITHLEFDQAYSRFRFENRNQEDLFFLELDRNSDLQLTDADFDFIFKFYDVDANGCVSHQEFHRVWTAMTGN